MPTRNTKLIKVNLANIRVIDADDALEVLDFIDRIMPQVRRAYAAQSTSLSLLRNQYRQATGKLSELAYEQEVNTPTAVEEIKMREDAKQVENEDETEYDESEALEMLKAVEKPIRPRSQAEAEQSDKVKEILKENKSKKTKK